MAALASSRQSWCAQRNALLLMERRHHGKFRCRLGLKRGHVHPRTQLASHLPVPETGELLASIQPELRKP